MNSLLHDGSDSIPILAHTNRSNLGTNTAKYHKYNVHLGKKTSKRIRKYANMPHIEYKQKMLSSSMKDYQDHEKRKNLTNKTGFNRKSICFFMEDTYLTVQNCMTLYNQNDRILKNLKTSNGIIDLYACSYKIKNQFKFTNVQEYYDVKLILHLVKINNHHTDVRSLIEDITNNKTNSFPSTLKLKPKYANLDPDNNISDPTLTNITSEDLQSKNNTTTKMNLGNSILKELTKRVGKERIKKLPKYIIEEIKTIKETISPKTSYTNYGRIPEDEQYSDPNTTDRTNKIKIDFETSLKTKLTDSSIFNENATIVKTWYKSLTPGSIWEINITHHLNEGIHLNRLFDYATKNLDHPAGYIFVLEQIGDRRGKLRRIKDSDLFTGYSSSKIYYEFEHAFEYLAEESKETFTESPCTYKKRKREEDFEKTEKLFEL
jgi:hypothetical protein